MKYFPKHFFESADCVSNHASQATINNDAAWHSSGPTHNQRYLSNLCGAHTVHTLVTSATQDDRMSQTPQAPSAGARCFFDCDPELVRTELRHRLCVPFFPKGQAVHLVRPSPRPSLRPRSGLPTRRGPQTPPTSSTNQPKKRFSTHREKAGLSSAHEPRPLSSRRTRPQKPGIMRTLLAVAKHPENRGPLPAERHLLHCRGFRRPGWRMKRLRPHFGLLDFPTTQLHLSPRSQ